MLAKPSAAIALLVTLTCAAIAACSSAAEPHHVTLAGEERPTVFLWLDTSLGRMALLGEQVRKIDQLSGDDTHGGVPSASDLAVLPRVRVRTPGGMFYGKVIARDEATVTLITEAGAKVTLQSHDVEDAPLHVPQFADRKHEQVQDVQQDIEHDDRRRAERKRSRHVAAWVADLFSYV